MQIQTKPSDNVNELRRYYMLQKLNIVENMEYTASDKSDANTIWSLHKNIQFLVNFQVRVYAEFNGLADD